MTHALVTHALTLVQPWATAVLTLGKDVENRTWALEAFIGRRIAIHAGKKLDRNAVDQILDLLEGDDALEEVLLKVPTGAILGTAKYLGFVRANGSGHGPMPGYERCLEALQSPWRSPSAKCMWTLVEPCSFDEPIPCAGALGLWRVPAHLSEAVNQGVEARS